MQLTVMWWWPLQIPTAHLTVYGITDHIFSESQGNVSFPQRCSFPPLERNTFYGCDMEVHPGWTTAKPRKGQGIARFSSRWGGYFLWPPWGILSCSSLVEDPSTSTTLEPERNSCARPLSLSFLSAHGLTPMCQVPDQVLELQRRGPCFWTLTG